LSLELIKSLHIVAKLMYTKLAIGTENEPFLLGFVYCRAFFGHRLKS